jgi:AcrR family transcriptional regulator
MPKVTEAYLDTRRSQILDAAIACFARKGFHQTTMEEIGNEAGLSPGVAYRYFENKEDIILATVKGSVDRSKDFFIDVADEKDLLAVLERMIDDQFTRFEQPGREAYYKVRVQLWAETLQNPRVAERARELRAEPQDELVELLKKGQERGQVKPNLDIKAATVAITACYDGFILQWFADPDVDIQEYSKVIKAMVRGLFIDPD